MGEKLLKECALTLVAEQMTASDAVGAGSAGAVAQALLLDILEFEIPCGVNGALANQFSASGV